jgi:hypothetical protein
MLNFIFVISSIFSIVLIFQISTIIITKSIEAINNARDSF